MCSSETKLSCIKTKMKRCTMTESLWNRYDISRKSSEVPVRRSLKVVRKDRELALQEPWDSTKIGWKIYELVRLVYFASLRLAARSAAAPADWAEYDKYEAASVLTTVTSQVKGIIIIIILLLFLLLQLAIRPSNCGNY